jgi:hypothetical protein
MKFRVGDTTDGAHCTALKHEFLRCEDAFKDFETYATTMIMRAQAERLKEPLHLQPKKPVSLLTKPIMPIHGSSTTFMNLCSGR